MNTVSRRTFLAGAAGLAGAGLLADATAAAAPEAGEMAPVSSSPTDGRPWPSAYRYRVGNVTVTAIADGLRTFPMPEGFVRNAPREAVNAALVAAHLPPDELSIPFTVLLLEIGGRRILVDTGNGVPQKAGKGATTGLLQPTLAALGIAPESIDEVLISHFHGDHINGLLTAEGASAFPKARVRVPEAEWGFWMDESQMSRAPEALRGTFTNSRRVFKPLLKQVETYGWQDELAPGLEAVEAAGHTPGHTAFELASGKDRLFIQSDLTNIPALFVRHPNWQVMFDMDGEKAARTRKRIYDRLASARILVAGYHFPFPGAAWIDRDGEGFRYVPVLWNPVL
ncbi:MBL fold metallo-hydrolase [Xanthobacter sp. TB0139]|uniref:MBL fold metallo-hydrolase n=1 Tax=Xanthobacter sp. TB0139 TaxID=3459178 RepID=UPI0040394F43